MHYISQSVEHYKGYDLEIELFSLDSSNPNRLHRHCKIIKDGEVIGIAKTKKELKDLIDHNCFENIRP